MMKSVLSYSNLVALLCMSSVLAKTYTIDVDKNECKSYQAHKVNQYQTYEIVWHGSSIKDCGVGFYAKGDGFFSIDHYRICVKPVVWNMSDCTSQLYLNYNRAKSVSCTDEEPQTFCDEPGVKLDIDVKLYDEKAWKVSTKRFTLQVYAKNTTHYGVWMIACICVLVLLLIGGLFDNLYFYWKKSEVIKNGPNITHEHHYHNYCTCCVPCQNTVDYDRI